MKKSIFAWLVLLVLVACSRSTPEKILEIQGKSLVSSKPPFTLVSPSQFEFINFSSLDYPNENSLTRTYLWMTRKENQAEEIFIVQIADRTNPQAEPIAAPPLKPETEKRVYLMGQDKKGNFEVNRMIQLIALNPDSSILKPIINKGLSIPSHWALQGQILFIYEGEHAVFIRYSKDVNGFGFKVSEKGKDWEKGSISGNEKKVYEAFQKSFMEMMDSIQIKNPNLTKTHNPVEKVIFCRLIKNAQMQGARNPEECGVLECTSQRLALLDMLQVCSLWF